MAAMTFHRTSRGAVSPDDAWNFPSRRSSRRVRTALVTLAVALACAPQYVTGQTTNGAVTTGTEILDVIPHDCWAFIAISNLDRLDKKLSTLLSEMQLPPFSLVESFNQRINLGPHIQSDGSFALVFMPAPTTAAMGPNAVLIFPCVSVDQLLSDFDSEKIAESLWRAPLVWGPTYVGQRGKFAILGSTQQAVEKVLSSQRFQQQRYYGRLLEQYAAGDVHVGIDAGNMLSSPALSEWLQQAGDAVPGIVNNQSALCFQRALLADVEYAYIGVNLNNARIRFTAEVELKPSSTLAGLLAFDQSSARTALDRLPAAPYIAAASFGLSADQRRTTAAEFRKLFESDVINAATAEQQRSAAQQQFQSMITALRSVAWGLAEAAPNPQGLVIQYGELQVDNAEQWLASLKQVATILSDKALFNHAQSNPLFKRIEYTPGADSINGVDVDHLTIEMMPATTAETPQVQLRQAFGDGRYEAQIAATNENTVLVCIGGYPRDMAQLLESSTAPDSDRQADSGRARINPLLSTRRDLVTYLSPARYVDTVRTLARIQHKVDSYTTALPGEPTPAALTVAVDDNICHIELTLLSDLVKGIYEAFATRNATPQELVPPPDDN